VRASTGEQAACLEIDAKKNYSQPAADSAPGRACARAGNIAWLERELRWKTREKSGCSRDRTLAARSAVGPTHDREKLQTKTGKSTREENLSGGIFGSGKAEGHCLGPRSSAREPSARQRELIGQREPRGRPGGLELTDAAQKKNQCLARYARTNRVAKRIWGGEEKNQHKNRTETKQRPNRKRKSGQRQRKENSTGHISIKIDFLIKIHYILTTTTEGNVLPPHLLLEYKKIYDTLTLL
jgi:hypothetical protein